MPPFRSFIETQFPVSKLSKESYKERKAGASQTLTGLGKWWGRKPLILVRATILGLLMPASDDPARDREIFLKILTMDEEGLWRRKNKKLEPARWFELATEAEAARWFEEYMVEGTDELELDWREDWQELDEDWDLAERRLFARLGYDEKLTYCARPEQVDGPSPEAWAEINEHLGTTATNLQELVEQLGQKQFGHTPRVGDAFCGGGSIPFEAARMGCEAYASDLNPAAALLTWAALNIVGGGPEVQKQVREAQERAFAEADRQITEWGIEHNEKGWRADAYLYCIEAKSPATGYWVPLAPSWVISEKYNVCAVLRPDHAHKRYHIDIVTGATAKQMAAAKMGTVQSSALVCPETGERYSIAGLRGDVRGSKGQEGSYGLRLWENEDLVPRPDDIFQERLYCIRYVETYWTTDRQGNPTQKTCRHYVAPSPEDLNREQMVLNLLQERFEDWQDQGYIPSAKIPLGDKTDEPIRTRGWTYWHHLFNPRQLLWLGSIKSKTALESNYFFGFSALISGHSASWNSRLCTWLYHSATGGGIGKISSTFTNQALNSLYNYAARGRDLLEVQVLPDIPAIASINSSFKVYARDARGTSIQCDFWITDPPYADAVNYHELGDFFLAWYEKQIPKLFPDWYADSKAALAVKGSGGSFNQSMVEVYSNLAHHMPANGAQVVMFTHQDSSVWADLALILWASGLQVTAAWTIQTETDAGGLRKGNYVQGTVFMVLRKQQRYETAFISDLATDVEREVRKELQSMNALEDKEDPNFSDSDYQLAAYVAALRVLTGYKQIEDIDIHYELRRQRRQGEVSPLVEIINSAVRTACEYLVPTGFDPAHWRTLSPQERFYIKGLEVQSHGEFRTGVFQELARGFGLREYKDFLHSGKANETRLATATEFSRRQLDDYPTGNGWASSLVRHVLFAIRETVEDDSPESGRTWLKDQLGGDYWAMRQRIIHILAHLERCGRQLDYWAKDLKAAELLAGRLRNDSL